jgi:Family of unknown function (DUF6492)
MATFALLLKSYSGDFAYAQRLVASFERHNAEGLTLYVVVPEGDLAQFTTLAGPNIELLSEALLGQYLTDVPVHGMRPGYINQEIIKLAFWELGLAENYFCVDSDAEFIRDFGFADFMANETDPYTVLVEDRELLVEPRYYEQYWRTRENEIRHIQELVGLDTRVIRTCHGHQVFSAAVLRSFKSNFLEPRGWSYVDALAESPYEFSWYNIWLQKDHTIEIHAREPLVKVFHHEGHHLEYILRGVTQADIARGYLAVVVNSNYSRDLGIVDSSASKPESLSRYLSYGEVGQLLASKFKDTFRRRLG